MGFLPEDLYNEYHDLDDIIEGLPTPRGRYERATGELLTTLQEWRKRRRLGMTDADHFGVVFIRTPARQWSKKELRNRIAWLRSERGKILGGELTVNGVTAKRFASKSEALSATDRKIAKYKKELFRRESARNQKAERLVFNAKRRYKRAMATRKTKKLLVDKWFAADRKSTRLNSSHG